MRVSRSSRWFWAERKEKKGYRREGWIDGRRTAVTEEKGRRKAQKTLPGAKGGRFGKSQQKLSLPQLPIFPHSSNFAPSGLVLPFCGVGVCCSRSHERVGAWMGTMGRLALYRRRLPAVTHDQTHTPCKNCGLFQTLFWKYRSS
jgi:hypothetical protein